jgi:hypothetical protein
MLRLRSFTFLLLPFSLTLASARAQVSDSGSTQNPPPSATSRSSASQSSASQRDDQAPAPIASPIPSDAQRMSKQTRYEIIRDFETQLVYARAAFPMGMKGLQLRSGVITPSGEELQQALSLWGPAIKPGDPAHISFLQIKEDHIHFEINGGPVHRKKWYQHIEVSGAGGQNVPVSGHENAQANPHGSYLDLYFDKHVPEMTAQQLRMLLYPVLDFNAQNKEQAYLDTVPPKAKEAIQAHHVLVGMNAEMVLHAKGKPPKKVREHDGETEYEEWIYGEPPADVDFVRIVGDEVVRVETMKVSGEKIVRTEKEVVLPQSEKDKDKEAKRQPGERPANAPSLRRPGEDADDAPKPDGGVSPVKPAGPPDVPVPPGNTGPGEMWPADALFY